MKYSKANEPYYKGNSMTTNIGAIPQTTNYKRLAPTITQPVIKPPSSLQLKTSRNLTNKLLNSTSRPEINTNRYNNEPLNIYGHPNPVSNYKSFKNANSPTNYNASDIYQKENGSGFNLFNDIKGSRNNMTMNPNPFKENNNVVLSNLISPKSNSQYQPKGNQQSQPKINPQSQSKIEYKTIRNSYTSADNGGTSKDIYHPYSNFISNVQMKKSNATSNTNENKTSQNPQRYQTTRGNSINPSNLPNNNYMRQSHDISKSTSQVHIKYPSDLKFQTETSEIQKNHSIQASRNDFMKTSNLSLRNS